MNELQHSSTERVIDILNTQNEVSHEEILAALTGALQKILTLEIQVERLIEAINK